MNLNDLSLPFPAEDIEWRVSRAGMGQGGLYCFVLAYITARAIQKRLDDVCDPANWRLEPPQMLDVGGKPAFACGLSIRANEANDPYQQWVTKWDVCEPTNIEPAKGGWSGAMKRAGAQWGIGRYLYRLDETFAEIAEQQPPNSSRQWRWAKLSEKQGGGAYWWKPPGLPAWAIPVDPEHEISESELNELKKAWKQKFAAGGQNPSGMREGFTRFVQSICGEFPVSDHTCWTRDALTKCSERLAQDNGAEGIDSDVPFSE